MSTNANSSGSLTRRTTLKGAGLAVGTLWVAPLVQVISMDSATAASAPPSRVHTNQGNHNGNQGNGNQGNGNGNAPR
jgi:hypothetical protein